MECKIKVRDRYTYQVEASRSKSHGLPDSENDRGRRQERRRLLGKVSRSAFQPTAMVLFEGVGWKEQLALVTPMVVELTREMLFSGRRSGRRGCEWSKKASAEYNNYFTSDLRGPGNWNFRATPGTKVPCRALARSTEHFQLWHYNLLPLPRRMRGCCRYRLY